MEAIRLPHDNVSETAAIMQAENGKKTEVDKSSDTFKLSPPPSKEYIIIKSIFVTEEGLRKSYPQAKTNETMMTISNYVLLFGVDQELTHFLINDCAGKIPVRFPKNMSYQSEMSVNDETKQEHSEWCSDEEPPPKRRKLVTKSVSQQNCRKCSRKRSAKGKSNKKECKTKKVRKSHRKTKASPPTEHHETELPMAEAIKLLSKGVISVCKPSRDCDVPKEVDAKRSQQDADDSIIEIIDDLSCTSYNYDEPNQIPILVDSEDDETPIILKKKEINSINKSTMTEDCLSPILELKQIININPPSENITNETPDSFSSGSKEINKTGSIRPLSSISFQYIMEQGAIAINASKSRLQIDSNFQKSRAQLNQTDIDSNVEAITEEHLYKMNVETPFNVNKVTSRYSNTIDESLISINIDENSVGTTVTADTNLHRNIFEPSPTVDTKCTPINYLFRDCDIKQITKELYKLIKCESTSGITSSSDQNQCVNTTTTPPIECTAEKQILLKDDDVQVMAQNFYKFSPPERRIIVDCLSDLPAEETGKSRADDQSVVPESLSISEEDPENLTEKNKTRKVEKINDVCFATTEYATQITDDKSRLENEYTIRSIETCSDPQNSTRKLSRITSKHKEFKNKNLLKNKNKNVKKKTIVSHAKRKTTRTRLSKKDLQRNLRFEKTNNDSANKPVGTVENYKNISNCHKICNNESDLPEPCNGSTKLEDMVKNSSEELPLKELNPVTKRHNEDEINDSESSEATVSNIAGQKGMREEIKQILSYIDKNILTVDPEKGVSINPNQPKTSYDSSHLNASKERLFNSEKQTDAMIQLDSGNAFNETPDYLNKTKNDPDKATKATAPCKPRTRTSQNRRQSKKYIKVDNIQKSPSVEDKATKATAPCKPRTRTSQNRRQSKKYIKVDNIQKSPSVEECNFLNEKNVSQLKQLKVVCERYPIKKDDNIPKNITTVQEEHCDSTTAVIENRPDISSPVEAHISQATCDTNAEYIIDLPPFDSDPSEAERQIINDSQLKTPSESNDNVERNANETEICVIDNKTHNVNKEIICVGENSTMKDGETEIPNSSCSIAKIKKDIQPISGALLPSPSYLDSSHLQVTAAPAIEESVTPIAQPLHEPNNLGEIIFQSKLPNSINAEFEKLIFDSVLNAGSSVGVENQKEISVEECIPKNDSEEVERDLVETISETACNFDFQPICINSTVELKPPAKLNSGVIPDSQLVNLISVENEANSKTLSNPSDAETVSSTTLNNNLKQNIQRQNMNQEEQFNTMSNSDITPLQEKMDREIGVSSNSNDCNTDFQDTNGYAIKNDEAKRQPDNEIDCETATFNKTNVTEGTPDTSHNITASEYILRKQKKSSYVELDSAVADPSLLLGDYLCFEEAVMLSDVNKMEILRNISGKQANMALKKTLKKRVEKDFPKLLYEKDKNNDDDRLGLLTRVTDPKILCQSKQEKIPPKEKIGLVSITGKTTEPSLNEGLHSSSNVLSSSSLLEPKSIKPVLDVFSDGAPQMSLPPCIDPKPLASIGLINTSSICPTSSEYLCQINSPIFPPIKSLESLSSSLLHSCNVIQESQTYKVNDYSQSESSRRSTSESPMTKIHSSPLSFTQKTMENQLELKNKVESELQLDKPLPIGLTISLRSNDAARVTHGDQPSPSVSIHVSNNQIPLHPAIRDSRNEVQEPKTVQDAQKLELNEIRKQSKHDSVKQREDYTILPANTQIQRNSNPHFIECNLNNTQKLRGLTDHQKTTKGADQKYIGWKDTRSQKQLHNLRKDVGPQRECFDSYKAHQNPIERDTNSKSNITGNNCSSQKEIQSENAVRRLDQDVHMIPLPSPPPPNHMIHSNNAHRQTNCSPPEIQLTHPNYLNPMYPSVPQHLHDNSISSESSNVNMKTNNLHAILHNNRFGYHWNSNDHNYNLPSNEAPNYQHSSVNLQSAQSSQSQVTNLNHINPNKRSFDEIMHSAHPTHSQIRTPPPLGSVDHNMLTRSYSSWNNPVHAFPTQERIRFPPHFVPKSQFLENFSKKVHLPPPQAKRVLTRRSSMYQ